VLGVMVNASEPPEATVCAPVGVMLPFAPAEAVIVYATTHALATHDGVAAFLLLHCASVVQAAQLLVASLQIGVLPEHWLSALQLKQAPVESQTAAEAFLAAQAPLPSVPQAVQTCVPVSQMGVVPEHWLLAVQLLPSAKFATPGAFGVVATTV
jgi:hypothetical protein